MNRQPVCQFFLLGWRPSMKCCIVIGSREFPHDRYGQMAALDLSVITPPQATVTERGGTDGHRGEEPRDSIVRETRDPSS